VFFREAEEHFRPLSLRQARSLQLPGAPKPRAAPNVAPFIATACAFPMK
jgi:hypothetical protein